MHKKLELSLLTILATTGCSVTVGVVGKVGQNTTIYRGSATGYMDRTGVISMASPEGTVCSGTFSYNSQSRGAGVLNCSDGQTAQVDFTALSGTSGYGAGTTNRDAPIRFTYGLSDPESISYLMMPVSTPPSSAAQPRDPKTGDSKPSETVGKSGTGFFVNDVGFAVTNAHVVDGCSRITISQTGRESLLAAIIAADRQNDLALVKVAEGPRASGLFRASPAVRQGEQILVYGFPLAGALASTGNLSIGNVTALAGLADDTATLQISAPVQPGNSGGPVVDETGLVVGVVQSKLDVLRAAEVTGDIAQNVNFAIKASVVTSFLDANGVGYKTATSQQKLSPPDLGDKVKAFTLRLRCTP